MWFASIFCGWWGHLLIMHVGSYYCGIWWQIANSSHSNFVISKPYCVQLVNVLQYNAYVLHVLQLLQCITITAWSHYRDVSRWYLHVRKTETQAVLVPKSKRIKRLQCKVCSRRMLQFITNSNVLSVIFLPIISIECTII